MSSSFNWWGEGDAEQFLSGCWPGLKSNWTEFISAPGRVPKTDRRTATWESGHWADYSSPTSTVKTGPCLLILADPLMSPMVSALSRSASTTKVALRNHGSYGQPVTTPFSKRGHTSSHDAQLTLVRLHNRCYRKRMQTRWACFRLGKFLCHFGVWCLCSVRWFAEAHRPIVTHE